MSYRIAAAMVLAALGLSTQNALAQKAAPVVPMWLKPPSGADVFDLYPDRAQRMEKTGEATVNCAIQANGTLGECLVLTETPDGFGFGDAATKIARRYQVSTLDKRGIDIVGRRVTIPIVFNLAHTPLVPGAPPVPPSPPTAPPPSLAVFRFDPPIPTGAPSINISLPAVNQIIALYPDAARLSQVGGRTKVACIVLDNGRFGDCKVAEEAPLGLGFGAAAIKEAGLYSVQLDDTNRQAYLGKRCTLVVNWTPADLLGAGAQTASMAQPAGPPRRLPRIIPPTRAQLAALYPEAAKPMHVAAQTQANCTVLASGLLDNCKLAAENPTGLGFGAAAIKAMGLYRVALDDTTRQTVVGRVGTFTINWAGLEQPTADGRATSTPPAAQP